MEDWFKNEIKSGVIIRHDVDRRAFNSLKKAQLENSFNIKTTYYFRIKKCSFKPDIINKISELGHEIGYHYEELSTYGNDRQRALSEFKKNLEKVRTISYVNTVVMHGKPTSKSDNRNLLSNADIKKFNLCGDAYLSIDYSNVYYFSDTGRSWSNKTRTNYRDYVSSLPVENVFSTDDLINFIANKKPNLIFLMTHPERWNNNPINYSLYYMRDVITRTGKTIYSYFR